MLHAKHDLNSSVIPLLPLFICIVRLFPELFLGFLALHHPSCSYIPPAWKPLSSRWLGITPAAQCQLVTLVYQDKPSALNEYGNDKPK